jgi:hypothetical protein
MVRVSSCARSVLFCISMVERVNEPAQYEAMSFAE